MDGPDAEIVRYRRASGQRLEAAEILFKMGLNLDAMYLGGYVAECA